MAKLIITWFTIVLLLGFALSYAAGAGAEPAGSATNLQITPGGGNFNNAADVSGTKAKQQVAGASKVLGMEDENCERIYGLDECMARRARAANLENAQNSQ